MLPWTVEVANEYGALRAACAQQGVNLGALDMMIAAQAVATQTVLVTRDQAIQHVEHGLKSADCKDP